MLAPTGGTLNHQQHIERSVVRGCSILFCTFAHDNFVWVSPQILTRLTSLVVVVLLMCTSLLVSVGR